MKSAITLPMLKCESCGNIEAATRSVCSRCLESTLKTIEVAGTGQLVSWTTIRRAPAQFKGQTPYRIGVIDLDCGKRLSGRLQPSGELRPGARISAVDAGDHDSIPIFELDQV